MVVKIGFGTKDIANLNWENLSTLRNLDPVMTELALEPFRHNYVLPQVMALLGKPQIKLIRNEDNKFSVKNTLMNLAKEFENGTLYFDKGQPLTKKAFKGILNFLTNVNRKAILPKDAKQVDKEWVRYAATVPLVLSAFKEFRNIKYSDWDFRDPMIAEFIDLHLLEILEYKDAEFGWSEEDFIEFRNIARVVKTGKTAGSVRHLNSTTSINIVGVPEFDELPRLLKVLLLQTWIWQPCHYTPYGIYNMSDIDAKAVPLIGEEIFAKKISSNEESSTW